MKRILSTSYYVVVKLQEIKVLIRMFYSLLVERMHVI